MPRRGLLSHVDLTVSDARASVPFYDAVFRHLGFTPSKMNLDATDGAVGGWGRRYETGEMFSIALEPARGPGRTMKHDRYAPGLHHLALYAESREAVDGAHALLVEIGAEILDPPTDYSGRPGYSEGYYAVFFADPDGLKLEIVYEP